MEPFVSTFESIRLRIWPKIEGFFSALPESQQEIGSQFAQRLADEFSPSGEFADMFKGPSSARIIYMPLWHMDAYVRKGINMPNRDALEDDLFASAFFCACSMRIYDDILDGDQPKSSREEIPLASLFEVASIRHLHPHFPSTSPLWDYYDVFHRACTSAVHTEMRRNREGLSTYDAKVLRCVSQKNALLKTYPIAVALYAKQHKDLDLVLKMMDALHIGSLLQNDIGGLNGDLASRNYTYPITKAALLAGYAPGTHPPIEGLYGALCLSNSLRETHATAKCYFEDARDISAALGIDALNQYLTHHITQHAEALTVPRPRSSIPGRS